MNIVDFYKKNFFFIKNRKKIRIYDCFLFFNENDLLEIRLNELDSVIDFFVIVESSSTFTKEQKDFLLDQEKIKKFKHKIIYLQNEEFIKSPNPWETETFQRNKIEQALNTSFLGGKPSSEDLIIVSDLDEIPKKEKVIEAFYQINKNNKKYIKFGLDNYYYKLNNKMNITGEWIGPFMCKKKNIITSIQNLRTKLMPNEYYIINDAGWHYSYIYKNINDIFIKLRAYSHVEENKWPNTDADLVEKNILMGKSNNLNSSATFRVVSLNKYNCPNYVLKNKVKYDKLIFKHEKTSFWAQITSLYHKKVCQIKEYTLGLRNKSSKEVN